MGQLKMENKNSDLINTNNIDYDRYHYDRLKAVQKFKIVDFKIRQRLRKLLAKLIKRIEAEGASIFICGHTDIQLAEAGNTDFDEQVRQRDESALFAGEFIVEDKIVQPVVGKDYVIGYLSVHIEEENPSELIEELLLTYADFIFHELELAKRKYTLENTFQRLEKKKEELKKAQEYNNTLLSITSHDLSSPLNAVSGYLDLMDDCLEDNSKIDKIENYHHRIQSGVHDVMDMLNQLSDISKIEHGRVSLDMVKVNLGWLVDEVCKLLESNAIEKDINLSTDIPKDPVYIEADTIKLKRVIQNLVANAIKYTKDEGYVEVQLEQEESWALIKVKDNGIGIPDSHYSKIFAPFVKLEKSDNHSSSGLGLYVASYFTDLMNGEISVKSKENKGSTFIVSLPLLEPLKLHKHQNGSSKVTSVPQTDVLSQ